MLSPIREEQNYQYHKSSSRKLVYFTNDAELVAMANLVGEEQHYDLARPTNGVPVSHGTGANSASQRAYRNDYVPFRPGGTAGYHVDGHVTLVFAAGDCAVLDDRNETDGCTSAHAGGLFTNHTYVDRAACWCVARLGNKDGQTVAVFPATAIGDTAQFQRPKLIDESLMKEPTVFTFSSCLF